MPKNPFHPDGTGVFIDTQDGRLDLADVSWLLVTPTGELHGVMSAAVDELYATPDQALREFSDNRRVFEKRKRDGYTCRAREHVAACHEYAAANGMNLD